MKTMIYGNRMKLYAALLLMFSVLVPSCAPAQDLLPLAFVQDVSTAAQHPQNVTIFQGDSYQIILTSVLNRVVYPLSTNKILRWEIVAKTNPATQWLCVTGSILNASNGVSSYSASPLALNLPAVGGGYNGYLREYQFVGTNMYQAAVLMAQNVTVISTPAGFNLPIVTPIYNYVASISVTNPVQGNIVFAGAVTQNGSTFTFASGSATNGVNNILASNGISGALTSGNILQIDGAQLQAGITANASSISSLTGAVASAGSWTGSNYVTALQATNSFDPLGAASGKLIDYGIHFVSGFNEHLSDSLLMTNMVFMGQIRGRLFQGANIDPEIWSPRIDFSTNYPFFGMSGSDQNFGMWLDSSDTNAVLPTMHLGSDIFGTLDIDGTGKIIQNGTNSASFNAILAPSIKLSSDATVTSFSGLAGSGLTWTNGTYAVTNAPGGTNYVAKTGDMMTGNLTVSNAFLRVIGASNQSVIVQNSGQRGPEVQFTPIIAGVAAENLSVVTNGTFINSFRRMYNSVTPYVMFDQGNAGALNVATNFAFAGGISGGMTNGSMLLDGSAFSTGTPVYVESDPVWTAARGNYPSNGAVHTATGYITVTQTISDAVGGTNIVPIPAAGGYYRYFYQPLSNVAFFGFSAASGTLYSARLDLKLGAHTITFSSAISNQASFNTMAATVTNPGCITPFLFDNSGDWTTGWQLK